MNIDPQLLLALRHIATSVAGAIFTTTILCVRKRHIVPGRRVLCRKSTQCLD